MAEIHKGQYLSYLLRLWRDGDHAPWRASLNAPGEQEIHAYPTLEALFTFLLAQTAEAHPSRTLTAVPSSEGSRAAAEVMPHEREDHARAPADEHRPL